MQQQYFILVFAHSLHGRLRRVHIPQRFVYMVLALAVLGCFSLFGFVSSYVRMAWKVSNYNSLRREVDALRNRYQNLQKVANQTNERLATLQVFASEVSLAYGIKRRLEGPSDISGEGRLIPTYRESLSEYDFLRTTKINNPFRRTGRLWQSFSRPNLWPVEGRLQGHFGQRQDPFSGEGAFHAGVDISAPIGTPVRATGDGVVVFAEYYSGYGRLVEVDHGQGVHTRYAHLSRIGVTLGQEVRRGEILGAVGVSGRSTGSHLHYEVRQGSNPVNPYPYLAKAPLSAAPPKRDFPF